MAGGRMRAPRPEEVLLLRKLATGPRRLTEGPVGRCLKRGWCEVVVQPSPDGKGTQVLYGLTDPGRDLIGA